MQTRIWRMICVAAFLFGFVSSAQAQSIKLLAPNVGWMVANRNQILWTTDDGANWKNITPHAPKGTVISAVFFLDTYRGWALLTSGEPDVPGGTQLNLAYTGDSGTSWSFKRVKLSPRKYSASDVLNGRSIVFADSRHGWLALRAGMSAAFQGVGVLLTTSDAGESWKLATATGWKKYDVIGPMVMLSPQTGWMVGAGANEPLLVTRDGGWTWQAVQLDSPVKTEQMREYDRRFEAFQTGFRRPLSPQAAKLAAKAPQHASYAAYDLPAFKDPQHGYICVTYPGVIVLFETEDGGVSWKPDRVVTGLQEHQDGMRVASALVDSTWITSKATQQSLPQLRMLQPGDHAVLNVPGAGDFGVSRISFFFADPRLGLHCR